MAREGRKMGHCSWLVSCGLILLSLDFVAKLQKCTTLAYSGSLASVLKGTCRMAGGDELRENLNPSQGLHAGTRVLSTGGRTENGS